MAQTARLASASPFSCGARRIFRPICFDQSKRQKPQFKRQGFMYVGSQRGRCLRRRKSPCFLRGEAPLGWPCSPCRCRRSMLRSKKLAAHGLASRALFRLRSQVLRLMPSSFHGLVADRDLASYSARGIAPVARRRRSSRRQARRLRSTVRERLPMSMLPIVVRPRACRWA